jgi:hypothetical protein
MHTDQSEPPIQITTAPTGFVVWSKDGNEAWPVVALALVRDAGDGFRRIVPVVLRDGAFLLEWEGEAALGDWIRT